MTTTAPKCTRRKIKWKHYYISREEKKTKWWNAKTSASAG